MSGKEAGNFDTTLAGLHDMLAAACRTHLLNPNIVTDDALARSRSTAVKLAVLHQQAQDGSFVKPEEII